MQHARDTMCHKLEASVVKHTAYNHKICNQILAFISKIATGQIIP